MYNSTIGDKFDYCVDCNDNELKPCVAKRCKYEHYRKHRSKIIHKRQVDRQQVRGLTQGAVNQEMVSINKYKNNWFQVQREKMTGTCCNCPSRSPKKDMKYWKWGIAHIFPKNIFISVMFEDENWIELCVICHAMFDRNLETAHQMPCWKIAVEKFKKFESKIKENHKYLDLFKSYIP